MTILRPLRWPEDRPSLSTLDTSFVSDYIFQVVQRDRSFVLDSVPLTPPVHKDYHFENDVESLPTFDHVVVAELDTHLVGLAAIKFEEWNRRAVLWHMYVDPNCRGQGIGRELIDGAVSYARTRNARCLWLETQNINYPAIQFYEKVGFTWCGLDTTLYEQSEGAQVESRFILYVSLSSSHFLYGKSNEEGNMITQICIVVHDVQQANANWATILGVPEATIVTIFPDGILHYTDGDAATYTDCQVALYQLDHLVLELIQPGTTPSPWRSFLETHGQGVFHFCVMVKDRAGFQHRLADIGVDLPYHIGYHPGGSYSYVDARDQLGVELSVNTQADYTDLMQQLLHGTRLPLDELR